VTPTLRVADLRVALSRHRALLAAGLAAGAVATSLNVLAPARQAGVLVLVARHDLAAGTALVADDVRRAELPRGLAPAGALTTSAAAIGHVLAAPVRAGEPLTDVRLAGAALLPSGAAGVVAVPVRVADAASAALVVAGDHVDVLAATATPGGPPYAQVVAADAEVLAVPTAVQDRGDGALVVVAASPAVASRIAAAAISSRLSLTLRPRG
jgi:Flp pilus assembly protein CpaB